MPTPTTVKLLVDEAGHEQQEAAVANVWSDDPRLPSNRRRRSGCAALCAIACVMFLLGAALGAAIYTYLSPGALSELLEFASNDNDDSSDGMSFDEQLLDACPLFPWSDLRLPRDLEPESYNLTLHPNITEGSLRGQVSINLEVLNATSNIILHAQRLNLSSFYINVNGKKVDAVHSECQMLNQWAFSLEESLEEDDEVELGIEFEGVVLADMHGLYISTHSTSDGQKWVSAATQFEPAYARKVFPCFDEPNMKATFQLSVVREADHVVRSNMNLRVSREHDDGLYIDVFHRSVKMSTYLLALAVLDNYDYAKRVTKTTQEPIEVRLYAPKDVLRGQSQFGLEVAQKALEFFEDYFNISYPLDKVDLIALDDFAEGAMENWGMITFRDSTLLFNPETSSMVNKEHIALVVCHEIAHQWFGNLVTMDWWNDLWLNEGFANHMEYKCVDHIFPDWRIMTRFYAENVGLSMEPDGLSSSRPISGPLSTNTTNIMSLFDAISYHKAASIIHMLQGLTGEWYFQKALIEYLNKYAYDNAKGEHLWKIVEKHAALPHGVTVQSLAEAFTTQVGYPVIYVSLVSNDEEILVHNQTRFLFDDDAEEDDDAEWPIPVHFRTKDDSTPQLKWLRPGEQKVRWRLNEPSKWIVANTEGVGYFKVLYDKKIYRELIKQLNDDHEEISTTDRTMLLVDAFDFTKVGKVDIDTYMDMLSYAQDEDDRMAWTIINRQLKTIEALVEEADYIHLFRDFQRTLVVKMYEKSGWDVDDNDSPASRGLQAEILSLACRLSLSDCTKQAIHKFNLWSVSRRRVAPELQGTVFEEGIRQSDTATWEKAYSTFLNSTSTTEKQQLMNGMAGTKDPKLIHRLLRMTLDPNQIRANAIPRVLSALAENDLARAAAWRFFRINFDQYQKILGESSNLLLGSIRALVDKQGTEHDLKELKEFLADKELDDNKTKLEQIFEIIQLNIQWRELNQEDLGNWLQEWDERRRRVHRHRKHERRMG